MKYQRVKTMPFTVHGRTFEATLISGVDLAANASVSGLRSGRLIDQPSWHETTEEEYAAWRKAESAYARPVISAALALFGIEPSGIAYSATRLCRCGCSGAYILAGIGRGISVDVDEIVSARVSA